MTAPTDRPGRRPDQTIYLAAPGFEAQLREELGSVHSAHDRLLVRDGPPVNASWAQNIWREPIAIPIQSINEGARALRSIQRNWALLSTSHHRRAALIADKLPHVSAAPLHFPAPAPKAPLGSWALVERDLILASADCSSPFVHGAPQFVENRDAPPNRAYLKAWEALTLLGAHPQAGERCLDLGSSPGGWTWVLQQLGAHVISIDKAPLDPRIAALPGVEHRQQSAFALDPKDVDVDWLFCDMACYPERLLRLVHNWLGHGSCRRFVCTLKFQGATDHATAREFAKIPGSRLLHLAHNKHELTWLLSH